MLVLPILGRMYNEGFRLWSASLAERTSDFVSVRHVSTSSCVVMFMSHNMLERINSGVPEVLAACRSSLLRAVVLLDDARPDNRMFALTSPEQLEYQRSNDSSFWLYAYSADYLERCRGPWPEVKLELREPTFDDVQEEVIAAEYINLEKIITRSGTRPETVSAPTRYPNNRGYIAPAPDALNYEPLQKVEAAKTSHDRDYDDALALLNQCADKQVDIIINHTRPGENTVAAKPSLSPIRPLPDSKAELRIIQQELELNERQPRPELIIDPEVKTKADMIVQPEDHVDETDAAAELPTISLPPEDLSPSAIAAGIEQIAAAAEASEPRAEGPVRAEEAPLPAEPESASASEPEPVQQPRPEYKPELVSVMIEEPADMACAKSAGKSTVQVVVRRQQPAVRVTPVKKRVITEPVRTPAEDSHHPKLSRSPFGSHLRSTQPYDDIDFEQYVRSIALSAVAPEAEANEAPVSYRRFGRSAQTPATETSGVQTIVGRAITPAASAQTETPHPAAQTTQPESTAISGEQADVSAEQELRPSARKSRFPHNSRMLTGLLAALRQERTASVAEEELPEPITEEANEPESAAQVVAEQHDDVKVIRLSDAISERKVSDLQAAVNRFMHLDGPNDASPARVVRTYGIRR